MSLLLFSYGFHGQNALWHLYRSLLFPKLHRSLTSYLIYWWYINVIKWTHDCFPCFPVFTVMEESPVHIRLGQPPWKEPSRREVKGTEWLLKCFPRLFKQALVGTRETLHKWRNELLLGSVPAIALQGPYPGTPSLSGRYSHSKTTSAPEAY